MIIPSRWSLIALATSALFTAFLPLGAQVAFTGDTYTQDFDSLPSFTVVDGTTTAVFTFTNNSTLVGWYSSVGTGSNNGVRSAGAAKASGDLYNWGASGDTDRALGLFSASGYSETAYLGLQLRNDTGSTINSVTLTFDVEQWRRNTNATTWEFASLVTSTAGDQLTAPGYAPNVAGNAQTTTTGNAGARDGNATFQSVSVTLTGLNWQSGDYLWLRWASDQGASATGLGLDNVSVALSTIPEPRAMTGLLGSVVLLVGLCQRKRTRTDRGR